MHLCTPSSMSGEGWTWGGVQTAEVLSRPQGPWGQGGVCEACVGPGPPPAQAGQETAGSPQGPCSSPPAPPTPQMPGASGRGLPGRGAEHSGVLVLWALWEDCPPHLAGRRCRPRPRDPPFPSPPGGQLWAARFYGRGRDQGALLRPGATSSGVGSTASPASPPPSFTHCGLGMSSSGLGGPPTEDTLCFLSGMDQDKCGPGLGYGMNRKTRTDPQGPCGPGMSSASCPERLESGCRLPTQVERPATVTLQSEGQTSGTPYVHTAPVSKVSIGRSFVLECQ